MNLAPITRFTSRNALRIKKNSPQILFYAGIVGTVATTVLASRATLKAVPIVERLKEERHELDSLTSDRQVEEHIYADEVRRQYTVAAIGLTKLYGPVVLVGVGSLAALTKSHQQLNSRNTALTVAYTGLFRTFESYRERVRGELGEDRDRQFLHGTVTEEIEYTDKNGKTKTKSITTLDPSSKAAITASFDVHSSPHWVPDPGYNQNFLDGIEDWSTILLQRQGHLFLNEVFDLLGMQHTREGQILGWVYKDLGNNDMFVQLGHKLDGEFVAGYKKDVILEFNIHGPILELI